MRKCITALLALTAAAFMAGCTDTDPMPGSGRDSFAGLVAAHTDIVEDRTAEEHYFVLSVDGETALKISEDYELTGDEDILIETPLQPFLDAGLDVSRLNDGYKAQGDKFYLTGSYGVGSGAKGTVVDALFESTAADRTMLTYHRDLHHCGISTRSMDEASFFEKVFGGQALPEDPAGLDRFGIRLAQGKFQYARDYMRNDKDIVFMITAKPLAQIGVDVRNVDGWVFTTMEDLDCSDTDVLLKTYDLDQDSDRAI